ncbi:hypothetical protein Kpho02_72890 [Kitasatospora phosalacinea]|uniref:Uncharacterized protein n=1 Tax=Kitasatospora phosalacinea TaxID=2065 RepID=A0A9W6QDW7_9ACTN|nr:hypothetical protein [Kitasatospora phosalacinea]GLW74992.1 hypothetical protein Kpho02_72890 [Kitasatospora phosalacinea]
MSLRTWIERRRAEEELEAADAARADGNLACLKREDPDAARIFTATFTAARRDRRTQDQLVAQLQEYAVLKHQAGRMDLYGQIFA